LAKERRPRVVVEIPDTEAGMPTAIAYDPHAQVLQVGTGRIERVSPQVWAYEVSGWRVVKRWFEYRKRSPRGRRSSKLDDVVPTRWRPDYTTELLNLLQVLECLVDLQPAQAELLDRICAGAQITVADLEAAAILPPPASARRPLRPEGMTLLEAAGND
jgi:Type ISP C-terminal specificity domain